MQVLGVSAMVISVADEQQRAILLLACSALVLVMAFGTALFYLRPARPVVKIVLATAGLIAVLWVLVGYGLAFGPAIIPGFLGNPIWQLPGADTPGAGSAALLHTVAFLVFQGSVAILTTTIIAAVVAPRVQLTRWLIFAGIWLAVVYAPIAYAVFNMRDGWLFTELLLIDQAGGTVVQVSAGGALLALLLVLRGVSAYPHAEQQWTACVGAALIWLGAFGLNVGSEGVVDGLFGTILLNTLVAPAVAAVAWVFVELLIRGRSTLRGAAAGVVTGVVAVTPACGILTPLWTVGLAVLAGGVCAAVVTVAHGFTSRRGVGAVGIHLAGGIIGLAYIGLFGNGVGWKDSGQPTGLADQAGAGLGVAIYSFVVAVVIAWSLHKTIGLRKDTASETIGATNS